MKKLILFLMLLASVGVSAQSALSVTLPTGDYYYSFAGSATLDTASSGGAWYKAIQPNKGDALYYNFVLKLTEVSATTQTAVVLAGRKFDTDSYSTITTVNYKGTGSDTTIYYTQESSKQFYRDFKLTVTPTNGKVKVTYLKASFKK